MHLLAILDFFFILKLCASHSVYIETGPEFQPDDDICVDDSIRTFSKIEIRS